MTARRWVDTVVHAVLCLIGIAGLVTGFQDAGWLLAGVGGLLVGSAAALVASRLRAGALSTLAIALAGTAAVGSAFAVPGQAAWGVLPTGRSLTTLAVGAVRGWGDLLTLRPPVELPDHVTVVPYAAAWVVGLVGTTLAVRWLPRRPTVRARGAVLLAGPLVLYLASLLLGTAEPYLPGVRGVAFGTIALVWLGVRRRADQDVAAAGAGAVGRAGADRRLGATGRPRAAGRLSAAGGLRGAGRLGANGRLRGAAVLVVGVVAVGALGGAVLVPPAQSRFVLRDRVPPPFTPLEFPSPLAGFREYSKLLEDETIFVVEGLEPGQRLRLATMDAYDGRIWSVAGSTVATDGSGAFAIVGPGLPEPALATATDPQRLTVTVGAYSDVWIPTVGYLEALELPDRDRADREALRYNPATGSAVLTTGLVEGDRVELVAMPQLADIPDEELLEVSTARLELAPVTVVPDVVVGAALEYAADARAPIERLRAIELKLQTTGFYSRGTASDRAPSVAGHGAGRMAELFTRPSMVGDEEQYASAFALMARSLGYPARVVLGFAPEIRHDGPVEVTGRDVTAWVEVAFEGIGWLPFFPTPERTDVPQDQVPQPRTEPQPQVRQPPRTQSEHDELVSTVEIVDDDEDDEAGAALPGWVIGAGLAVVVPAAILLLPALVVAAAKVRRMRRRRAGAPHDAVAGAWDELVDRFAELGYAVPAVATRRATARALEGQSAATVQPIARAVDAAVFAGAPVAAEQVDRAWRDALAATERASAAAPRHRRWWRRYRLRRLVPLKRGPRRTAVAVRTMRRTA